MPPAAILPRRSPPPPQLAIVRQVDDAALSCRQRGIVPPFVEICHLPCPDGNDVIYGSRQGRLHTKIHPIWTPQSQLNLSQFLGWVIKHKPSQTVNLRDD